MARLRLIHGIGYWWVRSQDWMDDLHNRLVASTWWVTLCVSVFWIATIPLLCIIWSFSGSISVLALGAAGWLTAGAAMTLVARKHARTQLQELRRKAGQCGWCGYDLRATPDRCPECGETFEDASD